MVSLRVYSKFFNLDVSILFILVFCFFYVFFYKVNIYICFKKEERKRFFGNVYLVIEDFCFVFFIKRGDF